MGACGPQPDSQTVSFRLKISADLKYLFTHYLNIVLYLGESCLFASRSKQLHNAIKTYLESPLNFDNKNMALVAIDAVHKLHPVDYGSDGITHEWLTEACLRHYKFIVSFPMQNLTYGQAERHYFSFLETVFNRSQITVIPSFFSDFMWHAHMQDHDSYIKDMKNMFKRVLDHHDDQESLLEGTDRKRISQVLGVHGEYQKKKRVICLISTNRKSYRKEAGANDKLEDKQNKKKQIALQEQTINRMSSTENRERYLKQRMSNRSSRQVNDDPIKEAPRQAMQNNFEQRFYGNDQKFKKKISK